MLISIRIRNLAIVKDLSLDWGSGLNVVTGETGAGKSILIEALGLVLGERASGELVRSGESRGEVEAIVRLGRDSQAVHELLETAGLAPDGDEVIVRREIVDGTRSRQFICDTPVALATLRRLGDLVVEIQGQHQHHALLAPGAQREALDRFAALEALLARVGAAAREANAALADLRRLEEQAADPAAQIEDLRARIREIEALAPKEDEEAALGSERALLARAAQRRQLASEIHASLYEEEGAAVERVGAALSRMRELAAIDASTEEATRSLEQVQALLEEVAGEVRSYADSAEENPARLEEIEARLAAYERLTRRLGCVRGGLLARLNELRAELAAIEDGAAGLEAARARAAKLRSTGIAEAETLSARRTAAAGGLAKALARELAALAMGACEVRVRVEPNLPPEGSPLREEGIDRVELLLSPNPGEPARPLGEIASGGELSRVMLAVNTVLGGGRRRMTLVFDEVDAGIGGRTAAVVGEKLRSLASSHQVIVVTHLPQIASLADRHYAVEKRVSGGRTSVQVTELDREGRVAEIARMMEGRAVTPVARRHAADMLRKSERGAERRTP